VDLLREIGVFPVNAAVQNADQLAGTVPVPRVVVVHRRRADDAPGVVTEEPRGLVQRQGLHLRHVGEGREEGRVDAGADAQQVLGRADDLETACRLHQVADVRQVARAMQDEVEGVGRARRGALPRLGLPLGGCQRVQERGRDRLGEVVALHFSDELQPAHLRRLRRG